MTLRTLAAAITLLASGSQAQQWDVGAEAANAVWEATGHHLKLGFEFTCRHERRAGNAFGRDADTFADLCRERVSLAYTPSKWLKFSGMFQDARAPRYRGTAPASYRDEADLQEGYIELFPGDRQGFGMTVGRIMLNYGDTRLIGSPQWGNPARTYDNARLYWRSPKARLELLLISPVKIRLGEFNPPVLGDRVWGTYNTFPNVFRKSLLDAYFLHRDQNRPGGFTEGSRVNRTDHLSIHVAGIRLNGPLAGGVRYTVEPVIEWGKVGPGRFRAFGWVAALSRPWTVGGRTLTTYTEYKFASGTQNPADTSRSGTFDQLYPAAHDKLGHVDVIGWRNIRNVRSITTYALAKGFNLNFMYDASWLASAKDSLYSAQGRPIARSANGTAGRYVGQEADIYFLWRIKHFAFGAGYGHLFTGRFLRETTPGIDPTLLYVSHSYSF